MDKTTYALLNKKIKEVENKGVSDERLNSAINNSPKFNELNEQYEHLEQQHNTFETSIASTVNSIESRVTTLENSTGSGGSTGSGTSVDLTNITNRVSTLETRHNNFESTITNSVNDVESRVTTIETNIDNCASSTDLNTLQTKHNNFETSITSTVNGIESRVTTLENNSSGGSSGSSTDISALQTQVNNLQTKHNNFETTITDRVEGIESRVSTLESNSGSVSGSGTSDGFGEKLIAHYIHSGNKEIQFTSFNFTTCEGTTSEAHGLTSATEVIIVPNDWIMKNRNNNAVCVPIEWCQYASKIKLTPVDDITLRLTKNDGTTLLPVDTSKTGNKQVDITKFHFEVPIAWSISNIQIPSNHVKIIMKGYIKGMTNRYFKWKTTDSEAKVYDQPYFPYYEAPKPTGANTVNCLFAYMNFDLDFRDGTAMLTCDNIFEGRADGSQYLVWNMVRERETRLLSKINSGTDWLNWFGSHSSTYALNSNGSHIYIYALGGV